MTDCTPMYSAKDCKDIQFVEDHLRKMREATMAELELRVAQALTAGIKPTDLRIVEVTEWLDREREFKYSVTVTRKPRS